MMQFIASKFNSSSWLSDIARPSSAFFVILIDISNIEMITGKLNTAMSTLLLSVFEAIAEIRLKEAEKPNELKISVRKNTM
jgi:hypothetical protein